jgi:hypothetical protein
MFLTHRGAERASILADVRALAARHPELAGRPIVDLPYVAQCARATLGTWV